MITLERIVSSSLDITDSLTLGFDQRQKSRQRVILGSGREAALMIERGVVLRGNDRLASDAGDVVLVIAAKEKVSTAMSDDALLLARVAYHLGNRHVPLQVSREFVRYQHDHVLDDMVRELGLSIHIEDAPFEPEAGAYGQHSHASSHARAHGAHSIVLPNVRSRAPVMIRNRREGGSA